MVQEPAAPQVIDKSLPTAGLVAHTTVSRFVDPIPYYRQGKSTPVLAFTHRAQRWHRGLARPGLPGSAADETPVSMRDPGAGKTKRAYIWAYARSGFDVSPAWYM